MSLFIKFPPVCPKNPPMTPPTKAPRKGTGIKVCPIIIPTTAEPNEPTAVIEALPICFIFLVLLVALFLNV